MKPSSWKAERTDRRDGSPDGALRGGEVRSPPSSTSAHTSAPGPAHVSYDGYLTESGNWLLSQLFRQFIPWVPTSSGAGMPSEASPRPSSDPPRYTPVLLHGPAGVGKTHLAMAVAERFAEAVRRGRLKELVPMPEDAEIPVGGRGRLIARPLTVLRTTASDLVHELAGAAQSGTVDAFRGTLHAPSLLIVEDIEFLAGRRLAQRELLRLIDAINDDPLGDDAMEPAAEPASGPGGKPGLKSAFAPVRRRRTQNVLLTAEIPPGEWTDFHPMLVSRILGGLTIPLAAPGESVRRALIGGWALTSGMTLDDEAVVILAGRTGGVVPVVRGRVLSVFQTLKAARSERMSNREGGDRFTASEVAAALEQLDEARERPTVHEIAKATARYFGVRLPELRGKSRLTRIVMARHCAIALAEGLCGRSLREIGRYFSGRNHTTMAHSCRRIREMIDSQPEIRDAMQTLRADFER